MKTQLTRLVLLSLFVWTVNQSIAQTDRTVMQSMESAKVISYSTEGSTKAPGDTVLFEDFNAGMPASWTLINYDSLSPQGTYAGVFGDTAWVATQWGGTTSPVASSTSWYTPAGQSNDWMIFEVTLPNAETELKWEAAASDVSPFNDGYDVYIAGADDTTSLVANGPVFTTPGENENGVFVTRTIDLDSLGYMDTTIYVAFRNGSNDANLLWIDNILVSETGSSMATATAQIIHNSADAAAEYVDIFVDDVLTLDSVRFRSATGFLSLPDSFNLKISPADAGIGAAVFDADIALMANESYVIIANGIVSGSGYTPSPAFGLDVFSGARMMASTAGNTDVLVYHGSTDAPTVDVNETSVPAGNLVSGLSYQDFSADYLELATADYVLEVTDNSAVSLSYEAPLSTLNLTDAAITVLASGFVDPSVNSNGPGFGLWVALASGGELVELPLVTGFDNELVTAELNAYPNPANDALNLDFGSLNITSIRIVNILGQVQKSIDWNEAATQSVDITDIQSGTYFIQVESDKGIGSIPIVIE